MVSKDEKTPEYRNFERIVESANQESDRGCALIIAANLEFRLAELLKAHCVTLTKKIAGSLFEGSGSLATFSARIDVCFAFGIIGNAEFQDLHLIRKIRNDFAHHPSGVDFNSDAIRNRCLEFSLMQEVELDHPHYANEIRDPKSKFRVVALSICLMVEDRRKAASVHEVKSPSSYSILPKPK